MQTEVMVDDTTGRKYTVDAPDDTADGGLTFVLNLHGGGSAGQWQRQYFPAHDLAEELRLVVAAPTAATAEPIRVWRPEADDDHLRNVVQGVIARFGAGTFRAFWLAGHSQGGMTSTRLLSTPFFAERVDGFLSLSGGRLGGQARMVEDFGPPRTPAEREAVAGARARAFARPPAPEGEFSFIYTTGEHEIVELPDTSRWAERLGAGARERLADVVDDQPGKIHDPRFEGRYTHSWGREPRPGTAVVHRYPGARRGQVVADVVRLDKGHTEGLEPNVTRTIVEMMVGAAPVAAVPLSSMAGAAG